MPLSPLCVVSDNGGPFAPTTNGVNVSPSDPIQIQLATPTGVGSWYLTVYGTDELTTPPTLSNVNPGTGQVISPTAVVSFTYPGLPSGRSIVFQSTVVSGSSTAQTTFAVYTLSPNDRRVAAVGESREGNVSYGWAAVLNPIMRQGAAYLYYNDGLASPATGSNNIQGALDYLKSHAGGSSTPPPVFVYQEGGSPGPNVFTSFAAAYAAASAVQLLGPVIIIDSSLGAPVIPSNAWNIDGMTLRGRAKSADDLLDSVTIENGATFTATFGFTLDSLDVTWTTVTSPVFTSTTTGCTVYLRNFTQVSQSGASQPFISVTGGFLHVVGGQLSGGIGTPFLNVGGGGQAKVWVVDPRDSIGANSLAGTGPILVQVGELAANVSQTQTGTAVTYSFPLGSDLTYEGPSQQLVTAIQGLPTTVWANVEAPSNPVVLPCSPLGQCDCVCSDGSNIWVGDGDPSGTTSGITRVYKTDGNSLLGVFPLPADASGTQAITSDGTHVFVLVDSIATTDCLYVLNLSGNVVGVGQFPVAQNGGEVVVQGGYCWCQDAVNGLTGYSIATMLANGPNTPTPAGKTLSATSGGSNNGITTDGTNLYATGGSTVWKIAPAGPSITTSVTPPFGQVNGVFYASIGPGPRIYCGVHTNPSTNQALVLTTALATVTSFTPTFAGGANGFVQVTAQDGSYLYLSAGNGVSIVNPSTFATLRADFAPNFLDGAFPECNIGSTVVTLVQGLNGLSGIQTWTSAGPGQLFIGNFGLQYAPGLPEVPIAPDYNLDPAWSWRVHNPEDGTPEAGDLVTYDWNGDTDWLGFGYGWFDFLAEIDTPTAPTNGLRLYVDETDGDLKGINPSGDITTYGSGSTGTVFVYREGGVASGNVYTSWATAFAQAATVQALQPTIIIDSSLGSPFIPSGTWNVDQMTLRGRIAPNDGGEDFIDIQDGATFTATNGFTIDGLDVSWEGSTTPVMTINATVVCVNLLNGTYLDPDGGAYPFFYVTTVEDEHPTSGALFVYGGRFLSGGPSIQCDNSGEVQIQLDSFSQMQSNVLTGTGAIDVYVNAGAIEYSEDQPGASGVGFFPFFGGDVEYVDAQTQLVRSANSGTIEFAGNGIQLTQGQVWGVMTSDTDGATITFDLDTSQEHQVTLHGNRTLAFTNMRAGGLYSILLIQDGAGDRTVTWPGYVQWGSGEPPALYRGGEEGGVFDQFLFTSDGTNLYEITPGTTTLQGYGLSTTTPSDGQILMFSVSDGRVWEPVTRAPQRIYGVTQTTSTTQTSAQTLSMFDFNPGDYPSPAQTITAVCIVQVASTSDTITLQLWNFTTATLVTTFTSSSITAVQLTTTLGSLPGSDDIYYWAYFRTGGSPSDAVTVHNAYLLVS
jgi:hypothetical protein